MDRPLQGPEDRQGHNPGSSVSTQSQSRPHEVNPTPWGAMNLPPSPTVQPNLSLSGCPSPISGAAQPVGQPLRRTAASSNPASFTSRLACANTRRPEPSPTLGSWTQPHPLHLQSRGSQPPARIRTPPCPPGTFCRGPEGGFLAVCGPVQTPRGCLLSPASIRTLSL